MEARIFIPVWRPFHWLIIAWNLLTWWRRRDGKALHDLRFPRRQGLRRLWVLRRPEHDLVSHPNSNVLSPKCDIGSLPGVCWFPRLCLWPFIVRFSTCRSICHPVYPCHPGSKYWRRSGLRWTSGEDFLRNWLHLEAYVVRRRVGPQRFHWRQRWWCVRSSDRPNDQIWNPYRLRWRKLLWW